MYNRVVCCWAFLIASLCWNIQSTDALQCYSCNNAKSVSECTEITDCDSADADCPEINPDRLGASRANDNCSSCCDTNNCNRQLCQPHDSYCHDDDRVDCPVIVATTINYCEELSRARTFCKNYCGLCSLRDGLWSSWSAWSDCSVLCGDGTQNRSRTCSRPAPWNGGDDCVGTDHEVKTCSMKPCPVHGGWTSWGAWGSCSVTCDLGLQRRDRYCSSPYPSADGRYCNGDTRDDKMCVMPGCTNGGWSAWASWGACSRTCGDGVQSRSRTCDNPIPSISSRSCVGDPVQAQSCKVRNCRAKVSAFTARVPTGNGNPLTFKTTVFNKGSNFNAGTGKFTCSVPGVYFFALSLIKIRSSDDNVNDGVRGYIRQNGHTKVYTEIDPNDKYADNGSYGTSATVTLRLHKGDIVDVTGGGGWTTNGSKYYGSKYMDPATMFSGFLIQPDEP